VWTTCGLCPQWIQRMFEEYILGLCIVDEVLKERAGGMWRSNDRLEVCQHGSLHTWRTARKVERTHEDNNLVNEHGVIEVLVSQLQVGD